MLVIVGPTELGQINNEFIFPKFLRIFDHMSEIFMFIQKEDNIFVDVT